jgi:hypothetical protein
VSHPDPDLYTALRHAVGLDALVSEVDCAPLAPLPLQAVRPVLALLGDGREIGPVILWHDPEDDS